MVLLHLGALHAHEQALVYLLAFGPFVLLALTIWVSRRRNAGDTTAVTPLGSPGERAPHRRAPDGD